MYQLQHGGHAETAGGPQASHKKKQKAAPRGAAGGEDEVAAARRSRHHRAHTRRDNRRHGWERPSVTAARTAQSLVPWAVAGVAGYEAALTEWFRNVPTVTKWLWTRSVAAGRRARRERHQAAWSSVMSRLHPQCVRKLVAGGKVKAERAPDAVQAIGNYGGRSGAGAPVKELSRQVARHMTLLTVDEYFTTKMHCKRDPVRSRGRGGGCVCRI